jgi:hypothetical protein
MSAAFFLLGNHVEDACYVVIDKLKDIQLAILICRIFDTDKKTLPKIIQEHFIQAGKVTGDCFL